MDKSELSEEEYQERKKLLVEKQRKQNFSNIFVLCASIFLVVETMVILGLLMIPLFALFSRLIPAFNNSTAIGMVFAIVQMVLFVGGVFLGFFIFRKVINWVIKKYKLEDRLTDNVKSHYIKKTKEEKELELRR